MEYIVYKDRQGYWRWQLKSSNGNVIADSGEGYVNKGDALHGISLVKMSSNATVLEGHLT